MVDEKLDMTWQCARAAQKDKRVLEWVKSIMASKAGEGILPLCATPHLEYCIWSPHIGRPGTCWSEFRATKKIRDMEPLFCEDRVRELGLFSQEKNEKVLGRPYSILPVPKGDLQQS